MNLYQLMRPINGIELGRGVTMARFQKLNSCKCFRCEIVGCPVFKFSPAISFFVNCDTQKQVDELWEMLFEGGEKDQCGWLKDKFGVSWQKFPNVLGEMSQDKDANKSERVIQALLQMKKIDIQALKIAYEGQ